MQWPTIPCCNGTSEAVSLWRDLLSSQCWQFHHLSTCVSSALGRAFSAVSHLVKWQQPHSTCSHLSSGIQQQGSPAQASRAILFLELKTPSRNVFFQDMAPVHLRISHWASALEGSTSSSMLSPRAQSQHMDSWGTNHIQVLAGGSRVMEGQSSRMGSKPLHKG